MQSCHRSTGSKKNLCCIGKCLLHIGEKGVDHIAYNNRVWCGTAHLKNEDICFLLGKKGDRGVFIQNLSDPGKRILGVALCVLGIVQLTYQCEETGAGGKFRVKGVQFFEIEIPHVGGKAAQELSFR